MKKLFTILQDFIVPFTKGTPTRGFVRGVVDVFLQGKGDFNLLLLNYGKLVNLTKEGKCLLTGKNARILNLMIWISLVMPVHVQAAPVGSVKLLNDRSVCHTNACKDLVSDMQRSGLFATAYADIAFTVKQTSGVTVIHMPSRGCWDDGEFGGNPMPGLVQVRKGNTEPSRQFRLPGVCREHVPSAEAKICSELHGDMQKLAEMTSSVCDVLHNNKYVHKLVTDCNTKYLHWRPHSRRNMVPLDPDRFSVNQDAGHSIH